MGRTSNKKGHYKTLAENARRARSGAIAAGLGGERREVAENERPRANWSQISPGWIEWFNALPENEKQPILQRLSNVKPTEIKEAIQEAGRTARELKDFACVVMKRRLSAEISAELPIESYKELLYLFQMLKEAPGLLLKVVTLFAKQEKNSKTIVERFMSQNNIDSVEDMTPANKAALLDQLRGELSDAGLDTLIVENSSSIRNDIRRELLKGTANRFRDFVKVRRARKTNPTDPRTKKERVNNAVDILNEISQGNIAQVLADVIEHLDLKDDIAEKLNMYTKKFNADDMIAFMCLNHKISFSVLDLMWRAAPDVFPSPTEIDNRLKQNLGKLKIGREVLEDGTMEARMFMYREVLTQRLQALLARREASAGPEERIIITWVLWLDGYSNEKHHHDPAMKTGLHRWVAAGKIVQMDKLDSDGKFHEIYRPDKVDSRRDAVPIIICRGKEDSATVRRYLESWSDVIDEGEQGMFLDAGRTQKVYIESWLACDQPMHSIIVGGSSSACSTPSLMRSTDETFSRVLPRLNDQVDKLRTVEMRQLKGRLADLIHKDKFSVSEITKAIAEAEHSLSERFQNVEELAVLKRFRDALAMYFADPDECLLRFDPEKIGRGDDAGTKPGPDSQVMSTGSSQTAHDQMSQQLEFVNEDGDRDLNEHGEEETSEMDELNHLSMNNLTGRLKTEAYYYAQWFISELAGQKTLPILPIPPQRAPIPLLHLEESLARFFRNAAATIAHDGGKLDELIDFWKSNHMVALAGTMQGNDCRSLVDRCDEWLEKIEDCPNSEDLKVLIHIWRELRGLLRSTNPTDEQREETSTMIQRLGIELNTRFPTTPWTNYIMELIWNVPVFVHDRIPLARKSEDGFEGMIWELKHLPTSGGGGTKTLGEEHREEPEYQILARLWSTHDPSNITERAKEVATKPMRSQGCTCCKTGGHNIRTCQKKKVRLIRTLELLNTNIRPCRLRLIRTNFPSS